MLWGVQLLPFSLRNLYLTAQRSDPALKHQRLVLFGIEFRFGLQPFRHKNTNALQVFFGNLQAIGSGFQFYALGCDFVVLRREFGGQFLFERVAFRHKAFAIASFKFEIRLE